MILSYYVKKGSFHFLSYSLDSLVKNLNKDDFKYLSPEFDNNACEYMTNFEKFKEKLPRK